MDDAPYVRGNETMNSYTELRQKQQQEVNALPIAFAFSDKQFREIMEKWGLDPKKDLDKIYKFGDTGGFYRKQDAPVIRETFKRHAAEQAAAIAEDQTGDDFIYQMFLCELADHEYGYTGELEDTLDALGYTLEQIKKDPRLWHGLKKAAETIAKETIQWS